MIDDGGRGLYRGCYFGELTRFAVLDIDAGSPYHSPQELKKLSEILAGVSLTATLFRSSESGGWHLYLPLSDWVSSKEIERSLKQFLKLKGYELKGGALEVFPSGNALRLPLQPGFAFLDREGEVVVRREEIERDEALRRFLTAFREYENNWSEAEDLITAELARHRDAQEARHREALSIEGFEKLYDERGKIQEVWELGRELWRSGLKERGQRHDGVLAVGHYLWYGDPENNVPGYPGSKSDRVRAKLIEAWLEKKHNGHCRHINEGHWDIVREQIARATVWREKSKPVERESYPLTERLLRRLLEVYRKTGQLWEVSRLEAANDAREEEARERIAEAVAWIVENGAPLTLSEVARVAGADRRTVRKNADLLEICGGVYITWGVRGGLAAPENSTEADQPCSGESDLPCPEEKKSPSDPVGVSFGSGLDVALAVAPLSSCLAQEPTTCTQYQSRALRVPAGALTPGPVLRGIQAGTAGCAGGIFLCYSALAGRFCFSSGAAWHDLIQPQDRQSVCLTSAPVCYFADVQERKRDVIASDRRRRQKVRGPPTVPSCS